MMPYSLRPWWLFRATASDEEMHFLSSARLIKFIAIIALLFATLFWRNNRQHTLPFSLIKNCICIITFVCKKVLCGNQAN